MGSGDLVPDGAGNRRDGVGAKAGATRRVIAAQGMPQPDRPRLERLREGERTEPLPPHDPTDQGVMDCHLGSAVPLRDGKN